MPNADADTDKKIELAKTVRKIYAAPRRSFSKGPFVPQTAQDELIVEALDLYIQESTW